LYTLNANFNIINFTYFKVIIHFTLSPEKCESSRNLIYLLLLAFGEREREREEEEGKRGEGTEGGRDGGEGRGGEKRRRKFLLQFCLWIENCPV
jgi:hypothetical protein